MYKMLLHGAIFFTLTNSRCSHTPYAMPPATSPSTTL